MIKINPTGHKDRIPSVDTVVSLPDYRLHSAWTSLNLHRWAKQSLNYPDRLTAIHRFSGELSCVWVVLRRLLTAHSFTNDQVVYQSLILLQLSQGIAISEVSRLLYNSLVLNPDDTGTKSVHEHYSRTIPVTHGQALGIRGIIICRSYKHSTADSMNSLQIKRPIKTKKPSLIALKYCL